MITKERLEELIEQGATIYSVDTSNKTILSFKICKNENDIKLTEKQYAFFEKCFENKAEAEWHAEFGCIERTDRLELPTWEEFWNSGQTIWFTGKDGGQYGLSIYNREILLNDTYIGYLDKENYTLACRKCKELFLGESK